MKSPVIRAAATAPGAAREARPRPMETMPATIRAIAATCAPVSAAPSARTETAVTINGALPRARG